MFPETSVQSPYSPGKKVIDIYFPVFKTIYTTEDREAVQMKAYFQKITVTDKVLNININ